MILHIIMLLLMLNASAFAFMEDQIDINMASVNDFTLLEGIDRHIATIIVEHRSKIGEFKSIEELIPIVSEETFEKIKFDIIARPLKDRFKNAINGKFTVERAEVYADETEPHPYFNLATNFNILDQVNCYFKYNKFKMSYGRVKSTDYFERNVGINIFRRENLKEEKVILSSPEPKVFKRIDLEKQKEEQKERIKDYFEKAFGEKVLSGSEDDKKVIGYFGTNENYVDYLSKQYSKEVVDKDKDDNVRYKPRKYGQPVKIDLSKDKKIVEAAREEEKKPGKKIKKVLAHEILLGDITVPYKKRPLVSADGQGAKIINHHKFWENSFFHFENHADRMTGTGLAASFDLKDRSQVSTAIYRVTDLDSNHNFNNFLLSFSKRKYKTEYYVEYDNLINLAHGIYAKVKSSVDDLSYSLVFNAVQKDYDNINDRSPYDNIFSYYIGNVMEASGYFSWNVMKNSNIAFEIRHLMLDSDKYSSGKYIDSTSKSTSSNIYFNYRPNSKLTANMRIAKGESYKGDSSKSEIALNYKISKKSSASFKHTISNSSNSNSFENYNEFSIDRDFSKNFTWSGSFAQSSESYATREYSQRYIWTPGNFKVQFDHLMATKPNDVDHESVLKIEQKF